MPELTTTLAIWTPGPLEITIILVIAVLLFGRRLPEIARSMGQSVTEFKRGLNNTKAELEDASRQAKQLETDDRSVAREETASEESSKASA